jgi:hypothetical protein
MTNEYSLLDDLNANPNLQVRPNHPSINDTHYFNPNPPGPQIHSLFHDPQSLLNSLPSPHPPILASLNIQSLLSKHSSLISFLNNSPILILALQETWTIQYADLVQIPGYNFIHTHRPVGRGGGVGFYISEQLRFKILQQYSTFIPNSFECLTIEVRFGPKTFIFSSVYRSPTPPINSTPSDHNDTFLHNLDSLLSSLSSHKLPAFICLDSNINLLSHTNLTSDYTNTYTTHGFSQLILKASRIQGNSKSLIDHILTNASPPSINTGVILNDISDHFPVFTVIPVKNVRAGKRRFLTRKYNTESLSNFKLQLAALSWEEALSKTDVDLAYECFFRDFKTLFDLNFPPIAKKFNKNFHKVNEFMTSGLLVSRRTKLALQKKSIASPTVTNISAYKNYRNIYNKLLRASKKLYFDNNLKKAQKNPKKTWSLLKEAIGIP